MMSRSNSSGTQSHLPTTTQAECPAQHISKDDLRKKKVEINLNYNPQNTRFRDLDFKERERLCNAAAILESNEMLLWHSLARCESVPQTKLHFERALIGIDSDDEPLEWEHSLASSAEDASRLAVGAEWCAQPPEKKEKRSAKGKGKEKVDSEMRDAPESSIASRTQNSPKSTKRRSGGDALGFVLGSSANRAERKNVGTPYRNKKRRSGHGIAEASSSSRRSG